MSEEIIDIYDDNKVNTGMTTSRKSYFLKKGEYILVVLAIVENLEGKYLITKRSGDKKWAAGEWEIPGGCSQTGETSLEAVIREVFEETGIRVDGNKGKCIYTYSRENLDRGDNYFVDIYHFVSDFSIVDIVPQKSEISEYDLTDMKMIDDLGRNGKFLHYDRMKDALKNENETR